MFRNQTKTQSLHRLKFKLKTKRPNPFTPSALISVTKFAQKPVGRPVSDQLRDSKRQARAEEGRKSRTRREQMEEFEKVASAQTSLKRLDLKEQYQQNKINQNVTDDRQHLFHYKDSLRQLQLENFKLNQKIGALKYSLKKVTGNQSDPQFLQKLKNYDSSWLQKMKAAQQQSNKKYEMVVAEKDQNILKILSQRDSLLKVKSKLEHRIADLAEQLDQALRLEKARDISSMKDLQALSSEQLAKTTRKLQAAETRIEDMTKDYVKLLDENRKFRISIGSLQTQIFNYKTQLQQLNLLKLKLEEKDRAERNLLLRWERSREQVDKLNQRIGQVQRQLDEKAGLDFQVLQQIQKYSFRIEQIQRNLKNVVKQIFEQFESRSQNMTKQELRALGSEKIMFIDYLHRQKLLELNSIVSELRINSISLNADRESVLNTLRLFGGCLQQFEKKLLQFKKLLASSNNQFLLHSKRLKVFSKECSVCQQTSNTLHKTMTAIKEGFQELDFSYESLKNSIQQPTKSAVMI